MEEVPATADDQKVSFGADSFSIYVVTVSNTENNGTYYLTLGQSKTVTVDLDHWDTRNASVTNDNTSVVSVDSYKHNEIDWDDSETITFTPVGVGTANIIIDYQYKWLGWHDTQKTITVSVGEKEQVTNNLTHVNSDKASDDARVVAFNASFTCTLSPTRATACLLPLPSPWAEPC